MSSTALAPNSWQKRLDSALLDVDTRPQSRFRLIQRALQDPNLPIDVAAGIEAIREDGFGKGHPTFIENLWPKGTIARSDIEGIQSLIKTIPERMDETESLSNVVKSTSQRFQTKGVLKYAFENPQTSLTLMENIFRRNPKKVETLGSTKLATIEIDTNDTPVEVFEFDASEMVTSELAISEDFTLINMGDSLAKLSSYVLGYNSEEQISGVTIPFVMHKSKMWIKRPNEMKGVEPIDISVSMEHRELEVLAMLEFSGICTNAEVERQKKSLVDILSHDKNWSITDESIFVFQYNAPGTLPWRRKNKVGLLVEAIPSVMSSDESTILGVKEETIDESPTEVLKTVEDAMEKEIVAEIDPIGEDESDKKHETSEE